MSIKIDDVTMGVVSHRCIKKMENPGITETRSRVVWTPYVP